MTIWPNEGIPDSKRTREIRALSHSILNPSGLHLVLHFVVELRVQSLFVLSCWYQSFSISLKLTSLKFHPSVDS